MESDDHRVYVCLMSTIKLHPLTELLVKRPSIQNTATSTITVTVYTSPLHYTCISIVTHYNLFPTLHCLAPWQCWCSDQCSCCHSDRPRHGGHRGEDSRLIADWPPLPAGKGSYPDHCGRIKECFMLVYRIYQTVYSM